MASRSNDRNRRENTAALQTAGDVPLRGRPANENDPQLSMMLARMRKQPSYSIYYWTFGISLVWVFLWFLVFSNEIFVPASGQSPSTSEMTQAIVILILPILILWPVAYLIWRTTQMRQFSEVLMQSAMRLVRPQDIASENLSSIARAVRGEVDALVDGVEHAFQRASKLEEIVHKEMTAVERAFGANEDRIRGLVSGLESQRVALQQTSAIVGGEAAPLLTRLEANTENLSQVIGVALETFNRLEGGLKLSSNELARTIEDVSARAAVAGNEIASQSQQFERMSTLLISDFRDFSGQLQGYVQTLNTAASNLGNESGKLGTEVRGMEANIIQLLRQSAEQLTVANAEVGTTIQRLTTGTSTDMRAVAAELQQTFGAIGENINYHLRATSGELATLIEKSGVETAQRLEATRGLLSSGFANVANEFVEKVSKSQTDLSNYVDRAANEVNSNYNNAINRLTERIDMSGAQMLAGLDQSGSQFLTQLNASGADYAARIEQASGALASHLGVQTDTLEKAMLASANSYEKNLTAAAAQAVQGIDQSAAKLLGGLDNNSQAYVSRLEKASQSLTDHLRTNASTVVSSMSDAINGYYDRINDVASQAVTGIDQSAARVLSGFEQSGQAYAGRIEEASSAFTTNLQDHSSAIVNTIRQSSDDLTQVFTDTYNRTMQQFETAQGGFDAAASDIAKRLNDGSSAIVGQLQSTGGSINELLVSTGGTIAAHLRETTDIVTRQMQDSGLTMSQTIETSGGAISDRMMTISGEFVERLSGAREGMMQLLETSATNIVTDLQSTTDQVYKRLENVSAHISDQVEATALRINESIDLTAGNVTNRVVEATERLTGQLDTSSAQLDSLLSTTGQRLNTQLEQATADLTSLFDQNTTAMTDQLGKTARDIGQRLDVATTHLDRVTGDVSSRLESTGVSFASALDKAQLGIESNLERMQGIFAEGLLQTTAQISARFEQDTGLLVNRIDKATTEYNNASLVSNKMLDDAHKKFSGHVQTANTYFADQLSTAAGELDQKLESISMQLTGKLEVTGTRMSERLEDVTALVDRSVDKFNSEMEKMLTDRKDVLDTLVSDASRRAGEVDAVMTSYMNMIEESLNAAESRSKEINRIVAEATAQSLARLEDELKKLEGNSATQVTQAARVLREQHERALSSMNEMLSATASDFQQTAQDMRITAQQVVKDIDAARTDLKRAVIDLPEETRSNADAMRKVVADQIAALNALSEVVRRQTGTVDFSGPGYINPRGSGPGSSSGKSEGAPFTAPQSGTVSALNQSPERTTSRQAQRMDSLEGTMAEIAASVEALSQKRAAETPVVRPAPAAPQAPRQTRATSTSQLPAHVAREIATFSEKLNVSAREVVEAIDDGLPRDLEKRFINGDTEVFVKRLHEQRSKRMISSIAKRYGNDRLLRTRMNGYIRLFEKLLDQLAELPGGNDSLEAVLASQHGQVYLALAEAAGRLPET